MQPLGRKPKRFPGKIDYHPRKGFVNWWETEGCDANKTAEKREARKEIEDELNNIDYSVDGRKD